MQEFIIDWIGDYGALAIWWLIFAENLFPPIPSEVILTFSGFVTARSELTLPAAVIAATIGSVSGALVLYGIGHWLGLERLTHLLEGRVGRWLRLRPADVMRAQQWFDRHGKVTVLFCRFVPLIRSLISLPAGMARMRLPGFAVLTTLGSAVWNTALIGLGAWFGESWETVTLYLDTYARVILGVLGIAVLIGWIYIKRRQKRV